MQEKPWKQPMERAQPHITTPNSQQEASEHRQPEPGNDKREDQQEQPQTQPEIIRGE